MTKDEILSALGEISKYFEDCTEATYGEINERFHRWMNAADWAAAYLNDPAPTIEGESWIGADKRPKKPGKYIVYGVTMFTPDHNGEPCGCWEIKTANWSDRWGWDCKVKRWRPLPELPKEEN